MLGSLSDIPPQQIFKSEKVVSNARFASPVYDDQITGPYVSALTGQVQEHYIQDLPRCL